MLRKGTKRSGARRRALRLRRSLGLAPRGATLLACAAALSVGATGVYGATLPALASARAERTPHVERHGKSALGSTTGYVWASILDGALFGMPDTGSDGAAPQTVTLANGETIVLTSVKNMSALTSANVTQLAAKAEQKAAENTGGGQGSGAGSSDKGGDTGSGTGDGAGSSDGSGQGSSGGQGGQSDSGATDDSNQSNRPSAESEAQIHAWLVTKANALNGYVASVNAAVATYNATGDISTCDSLADELFYIRCEFGRQTFSTRSVWYSQFANLWGAYTNLDIYVGRYGEDQDALATFNAKMAAISL